MITLVVTLCAGNPYNENQLHYDDLLPGNCAKGRTLGSLVAVFLYHYIFGG